MTGTGPERAAVWIGRGPVEVEARLLAELAALVAAGRRDAQLLAAPVRVVVPSASLAHHVEAALVRELGAPALGVSIRTLHALAQEILGRAAVAAPGGELVFPALLRQAAREEQALRDLAALDDGYAVVEANVRDLLDAGFEPAHGESLEDAVAEESTGAQRERAQAVVRVAVRVANALEADAAGHPSVLLRRAREALEARGDVLPTRALLLHGFADATGVQLDLIEALLRLPQAVLLLDRPRDPADPTREDAGVVFTRRVAERLALVAAGEVDTPTSAQRIEVLHAPGVDAEVRAVAERIAQELAAGTPAERIALVARELSGYRLAIRRHFARLGIPFSGEGELGPQLPRGRRILGVLALLRDGARLAVERWLDLDALAAGDATTGGDLRLALHCLGAARLGDAAALVVRADADVALPVRAGLEPIESGGARARRRRLSGEVLARATARAGELLARLEAWPRGGTLEAQLAWLRGLLCEGLAWSEGDEALAAFAALWEAPDARLDVALDREDFLLILERELADAGRARIGGAGAGVQVLSVMEARARVFASLFSVGLNRDVFPRNITEDPLLPDALRARLRVVLPDLPVKREGTREERFLFAQLLAASPDVTLSCSVTDDAGRRRLPSPLLERLRLVGHVPEPRGLPALHGHARAVDASLGNAQEVAIAAALHGTPQGFERAAAAAFARECRAAAGAPEGAQIAAARLAVLRELSAVGRGAPDLGPYLGDIGPLTGTADPRAGELYVTTAERTAACPWQAFLERLLRLELLPDAMVELPRAQDGRLVGAVTHAVLEAIASEAGVAAGTTLADVVGAEPRDAPWPEAGRFEELLEVHARRVALDAGVGLPGYWRVLAGHTRTRLERARELCWAGGTQRILGVEVLGVVSVATVEAESRELHFRADRVDAADEGVALIDYKTGKPAVTVLKHDTRDKHYLAQVAAGRLLQATAYAQGARQCSGGPARGEYVYLVPEIRAETVRLGPGDAEEALEAEFANAMGAVLDVWNTGSFFPRVVSAESELEPGTCKYCDVKDACWRGDSGARARLLEWGRAHEPGDESLAPRERARLELWLRAGDR